MSFIDILNLSKNYNKSRGINNINISIDKGDVFGFIGPNGAGKSTTIRCVMDMINKNDGDIIIDNNKVTRKDFRIRKSIGYLPSEICLYEDLTVKKMLEYSASFYKKDCSKRIDELVKILDVDLSKKIDELSLGNLKKVGIIIALMHEPDILIMDEATSGLDPLMQEKFYEIIKSEKEKGTTIFFSSHNLSEVKRICDKVAIIKEGKIIKIDKIENLVDEHFVKVLVETNDVLKLKESIQMNVIDETENSIKFMYNLDVNDLIKELSKYSVNKLFIEEPELEEIFMHYYKEEGEI